jgi:hypothetical protein
MSRNPNARHVWSEIAMKPSQRKPAPNAKAQHQRRRAE